MRSGIVHGALLGFVLGIAGMGSGGAAEPAPKVSPSTRVATNAPPITGTNAPAGGTNSPVVFGGVVDAETRELKPHDTFRYRIAQDPNSGAEAMRVSITDSGEAHFNVSRAHSTYVTVKAAGRRIADVRKELKEKLDAEYYIDSTLNLDLDSVYNPANPNGSGPGLAANMAKVQIFGELMGNYPVTQGTPLWLSDVILAYPKNDYANLSKIKVFRVDADGKPETHIVDINKVLNKNDRSADFELKEGDRIHVPRKLILGL